MNTRILVRLTLVVFWFVCLMMQSGCGLAPQKDQKNGSLSDLKGFLFLQWDGYFSGEVGEIINVEIPFFDFNSDKVKSINIIHPPIPNTQISVSVARFSTTKAYAQNTISLKIRFNKPGFYKLKNIEFEVNGAKTKYKAPVGEIIFDIKPKTLEKHLTAMGGTGINPEVNDYIYAITLKNISKQKIKINDLEFKTKEKISAKKMYFQNGKFELAGKWYEWTDSSVVLSPGEIKTIRMDFTARDFGEPKFKQIKPIIKYIPDKTIVEQNFPGHVTIYSPNLTEEQLKLLYRRYGIKSNE
ncbi:hypothetical protein [Thermincola potens]|uniref:Uncharacterized protein n=1 Tax=Thermincola potens (strain JR) TaxID=635013 RepID=D5XBP9_THEPJ|nr:hypothetical protein [Thermincola potens]ADG81447.1 hypothetical protein TherJR_0571 [Thermincola potens JR]